MIFNPGKVALPYLHAMMTQLWEQHPTDSFCYRPLGWAEIEKLQVSKVGHIRDKFIEAKGFKNHDDLVNSISSWNSLPVSNKDIVTILYFKRLYLNIEDFPYMITVPIDKDVIDNKE